MCAGRFYRTSKRTYPEVIEVQSLEELAILGTDKIKGKIVFITDQWIMNK
jgi:hypothetical protein